MTGDSNLGYDDDVPQPHAKVLTHIRKTIEVSTMDEAERVPPLVGKDNTMADYGITSKVPYDK